MNQFALPIAPSDCLAQIIVPALQTLPDARMRSPQIHVLLLATAIQETGLRTRVQAGNGPARGLWQAELGFVRLVAHNCATDKLLYDWCVANDRVYGSVSIYNALATDDDLACVLSRFGYWCDARPLPEVGDLLGAWNCYERVQNPGKPDYHRWKAESYPQALDAVQATL